MPWYVPAPQLRQLRAAAAEYKPAAQLTQAVLPLLGWYVPAAHAEQLTAPEPEYVLFAQAVKRLALAAQYEPAGHMAAAEAPATQ